MNNEYASMNKTKKIKKKVKNKILNIFEIFKYIIITFLILILLTHKSSFINKIKSSAKSSSSLLLSSLSLFSSSSSSSSSTTTTTSWILASSSFSKKKNVYLDPIKLSKNNCTGINIDKYKENEKENLKQALVWCHENEFKYHVEIGLTWGFLPNEKRKTWDKFRCNEILKIGKCLSCEDRYGWKYMSDWINKKRIIVNGMSNVTCATNLNANTACKLNNVMLDFQKLDISRDGRQRKFYDSFLTTHGNVIERGPYPDILGRYHSNENNPIKCDEYENRPTFVLSNDDIYNLGHYYNDLMGIWANVVFFGIVTHEALLINIDGVRQGGPGGSLDHRVMSKDRPDEFGPYNAFYESWFHEIKKGIDYKDKKVCYKNLYFMPIPGVAWFWNDWGVENLCAKLAPSPIYQSFNLFLREKWVQKYGILPLPGENGKLHVVIEARHIDYSKNNNHATSRHIKNLDKLVETLSSIDNIYITVQNFAKIPFKKQVALAHSASIFLSMHGAGTTHIFHSAIGEENCCALIELQPDHSIGFQSAWGYANIARMLGMHYYRYEAEMHKTSEEGTEVDIIIIKKMVETAINDIKKTKFSCLHDIQDTRESLFQF